ncbi:ribonuclease H-like domain-containing protein [Tanacetum coccineum]
MENVLVKIDNFVFPCDFVVIDMPGILGEMMILGKSFLANIHAQNDVFNGEISFGIGEDRVKLDVNGNSHHSNVTLEKIMDKCKIGLGYNVIPPPYTGNFMPPKHDLVYPSLDDFVEVSESVSESVVEKPIVETNEPETARKENKAPIIKD